MFYLLEPLKIFKSLDGHYVGSYFGRLMILGIHTFVQHQEATLWSNVFSYYVTVLPLCRYKREKEDPLPAAHSLHMVLNAVLSNFSTPLVDFQVPTISLHIRVDDCMKMMKQDKGVMQLEHGFTMFFYPEGQLDCQCCLHADADQV